MIAPTPFFNDRGCHIRIYEEARALKRRGHVVKIVTYHNGNSPKDVAIARTIYIPWYKKIEAGPSWHKLYLDIFLLLKTLRVNWGFRADIVHGHLHEGCLIGWVAARLYRVPIIFDYQGSMTEEMEGYDFIPRRGVLHSIFYAAEFLIDRMPDKILTSASSLRKGLETTFRVTPARIGALLDGVNTTEITPGPPDQPLRTKLGIPEEKRVVAYVGSFSEIEGISTLLRAAAIVVKKMPDVFFLIAGYPQVEEYRAQAHQLGLDDHTLFPGRIPYREAPTYANLGEVFLTPKPYTEANGKLFLYMALGKPIIAFDHPTNREALAEFGSYPEAESAEAFAKKIIETLDLPKEEFRVLGTGLRTRAQQHFSWDARAKNLETEYTALIAKQS